MFVLLSMDSSFWPQGGWFEALLVQEDFILLSRPFLAGHEVSAPKAVEFDRGWVLDSDPANGVTHAVLMLGDDGERGTC